MILPSDSKDRVRKLVYLYEKTKDQLSDERNKWDRYNKLYNNYVDEANYQFPFKVFVPWTFSIIETKIPRFVNGLLYRNPIVSVSASHPVTADSSILAASRLLNGKWMTDQKTYRATTMMFKEGISYGTSWGLVHHKKRRRRIRERIPTGVEGVYQMLDRSILDVNRPELLHQDLWTVYPDLDVSEIDEMKYFLTESIIEMEELEFGEIEYKNIESLRAKGNWSDPDEIVKNRMEGVGRRYKPDQNTRDNELFNPRHVLQCFVQLIKKDGSVEYRVIAIGNLEVEIRNEQIDYWPVVGFRNIPQPHELLGLGEAFSLESLQLTMNDFTNMELTNALMALTKMWLVGDAADADLDQFILEPFNVIQVSDVSQVKELTYSGMDNSGDRMVQMLVGAMQQASGIQDYLQGQTPDRQEYATTVLALQNASEARIDCQIKWAERETISEIARKMIECAQYNLTEAEYVPNDTGKLEGYTMDDLQGLHDYQCNGVSSGVQELKKKSYMDLASTLGQLLGEMMPMEVRVELARKVSKTFDGLEGVDEILSTLTGQNQQMPGGPQIPGSNGVNMPPGMGAIPQHLS